MSSELPDCNNVYSTINAPVNVVLAKSVLAEEFPDGRVWIYVSGYDGAKTLHVESDDAEFEGYPASADRNPSYLFNGRLSGEDSMVIARIQSIVRRFESAGFSMSIEVYNSGEELIGQFTTKRRETGSTSTA